MSTAERRRLRRGRPRPLPRGEAADAGQEPEALAFVHLPELILVGGRKTGLCNLGKGPGGGSRPPSLVICGALLGRAWEAGRRQGPSRQG